MASDRGIRTGEKHLIFSYNCSSTAQLLRAAQTQHTRKLRVRDSEGDAGSQGPPLGLAGRAGSLARDSKDPCFCFSLLGWRVFTTTPGFVCGRSGTLDLSSHSCKSNICPLCHLWSLIDTSHPFADFSYLSNSAHFPPCTRLWYSCAYFV